MKFIKKFNGFSINKTLKELSFERKCSFDPSVLAHFPNIERFDFIIVCIKGIGNGLLIIYYTNDPEFIIFFNKLRERNQLEELTFWQRFNTDEFIIEQLRAFFTLLFYMTNLKRLKLQGSLLLIFLPLFKGRLAKQERFSMVTIKTQDESDLNYLLEFVKASTSLKILECMGFDFNGYKKRDKLMKIGFTLTALSRMNKKKMDIIHRNRR